MASRSFGIIPVLSSTASLTFCFTEYWTLLPFRQPEIPPQSLSAFQNSYLYQTIPGWVGFGLISIATGFLNWKHTVGTTRSLYGWGTAFTLGHYIFGPTVGIKLCLMMMRLFEVLEIMSDIAQVAKLIEKIVYGPSEEAKGSLAKWLKVHTVRMLLTDLPAMVCFVQGFLELA